MKMVRFSLALASVSWVCFPAIVHAEGADQDGAAQLEFDSNFLMKPASGETIDVSRFAKGNPVMPGEYATDVHLDGAWIGRKVIRFVGPNGQAKPCFDQAFIGQLNLKSEVLAATAQGVRDRIEQGQCADLDELVEEASYTFDLAELRMDISVPQAALRRTAQGYVDPEFWETGVPSATLAYNLNSYETHGRSASKSTYLSVDAGVNVGSWHLRQRSSLDWQTAGPRQYQNIATYLQHDMPSLRSQLTFGDSFTDGAMFDSIGLRGVQLTTDDRMLPDSQRGYAPSVRGIAQSNARVEVMQNGIKLYETTVTPGPFEINDLYATGYGGDLQVNVTEADGSQHSFSVPYASVVQLLRPGTTRYSAAIGRPRDGQSTSREQMLQLTLQHGFTNLLTGYGGAIAAQGYQAGVVGTALNTSVGAFAFDVTQARIDKPAVATGSGRSARVSYSRFMPSTKTNLTVASYRYSSSGFWSPRDALLSDVRREDRSWSDMPFDVEADGGGSTRADRFERRRNELQLTLNQTLPEGWGSAYVVGSSSDYWNRSGRAAQFQMGYNNMFRAFGTTFSYSIAASRQRDGLTGQPTSEVFASLSIPLGSRKHPATLSLAATNNSRNGNSEQAMLTGTAFEDNALTYGVSANRSSDLSTGGGNVQYRSSVATVSASASSGSGYSQYSAGLKGAVVAHPGGVTLANDLGETIGIVEARNAKGARITNAPGVHVDSRGYAVIPYLTPYALNDIELDPKGLPLDVELKATSAQVAPRANSVVMIQFATVAGRAAMFDVRMPGDEPPPFGTAVLDEQGAEVGVVGQGGRVLVQGAADTGVLSLRWGNRADQQCHFRYQLPERDSDALAYPSVSAQCAPIAETRT